MTCRKLRFHGHFNVFFDFYQFVKSASIDFFSLGQFKNVLRIYVWRSVQLAPLELRKLDKSIGRSGDFEKYRMEFSSKKKLKNSDSPDLNPPTDFAMFKRTLSM